MNEAAQTPTAMANDLYKAFMANPNTKLSLDEMITGFTRVVAPMHQLRNAADAADMVRALLANPNTVMTLDEMIDGLHKVDVMLTTVEDPQQFLLPAPSAEAHRANLPAVVEAEPELAPSVAPSPVAEARIAKGTSIRLRAKPRAGQHLAAAIWPDATEDQRVKFMRLIDGNRLHLNERGEPIPVKSGDRLITDDGWRVYCPIDGLAFTMLKHHIRTDYDLSYAELLMMFKLTPEQLPKAGPKYSESKSHQAKLHGLGKNKPRRIKGPEPVSEGTADLFLPQPANAA